jgi:hypothetical protein
MLPRENHRAHDHNNNDDTMTGALDARDTSDGRDTSDARDAARMPVMLGLSLVCVGLCFTLAACDRTRWYPVPQQRASFEGFPSHAARVVDMDDPDADRRFVRDILPRTDTSWRWTGQRPAIKIRVRTDKPLKYTIDFTLPKITFKDTGPVTIAFTVNGRLLDRVRYTEPGFKHFEKAVPPDWLPIDEDAVAGAEIDKLWTDPDGGKKYGFIITRMGLEQ